MVDVLDEILHSRERALTMLQDRVPLSELENRVKQVPASVPFLPAITDEESIDVIAEMKRKSPSAGVLVEPYQVKTIAQAYERGGAKALSVLTEPDRFGGAIEDIHSVREVSCLPILRKDFIFDPYQIYEAKVCQSSAVLLIADMLDPEKLKELVWIARKLSLEPVVEVFSSDMVPSAINSGAKVIGINSRNLRTLAMNPGNFSLISQLIPRDRLIVAESGFNGPEDIARIKSLRISAVLIGESLLKSSNLEEATRAVASAGKRDFSS